MRKRLLSMACAALLGVAAASAQKCVVYSIVGKPTVATKNGWRPLRLREELQPSQTITIPYNATLELFDQRQRRKYIISTPGTASVTTFLKDKRNEDIPLSDRFFRHMLARIRGKDEVVIQTCSDPATVTREQVNDSTVYVMP